MAKIPFIAIVDDDEAVRESLCELLTVSGLACRCFESAPAFLSSSPTSHFDGVITDIKMPGMSGLDLLDRLRRAASPLPAIVLTSVTDERDRKRALDLGASAWLIKPVADDVLLGHLQSALAQGDYLWPEDLHP